MKYIIKSSINSNMKNLLRDEKLKFMRGVFESLNVDVQEWDMSCSYDVDLRFFLKKLAIDNMINIKEEEDYLNINNKFEWRVIDKYLTLNKEKTKNELCIHYIVETKVPEK